MDIAADVVSEARLHTKQAGQHALGGLQGFGSEFLKQILGGGNKVPAQTSGKKLSQMQQADKEFSDAAYAQTRARVTAIYEQYRQKKLQEEQAQKQEEEVKIEKLAEIRGEKKMENDNVVMAKSKASAETGKTYGAE